VDKTAIEDPVLLPNGRCKILVRPTNNDPFGDGRWAFLSASALLHLERWLEAPAVYKGTCSAACTTPPSIEGQSTT